MMPDTDLGDPVLYCRNNDGSYIELARGYITEVICGINDRRYISTPVYDWDEACAMFTKLGATSIEKLGFTFEEPKLDELADSQALSDFLDSFTTKNEVITSDSM